jgi:predicted Zn-dependent protease
MTALSSLQPSMEAKNAWVGELKALYPEHPQVLDLEAQLALKQGAAKRAVAIYKGLHERFPEESVWTLNLANAQWEAGDKDGHIATLTTWLDQHPKDVRAQYRLALSYLALERLDAAKSAFAKVVELQPDNAVALNNLALLSRDEDPQKALTYAERAYELNPDPRVMDTLGVTLLHQGETRRALKLLQDASMKRPDLATIKYHYAMALSQSGRQDEARKVLKRLADADFPEKAEAHALLAELGD